MSLIEFKLNENQHIRTLKINDIIYFVANDICNALNLTNTSSAISSLDEEDKIQLDPKLYLRSNSNQHFWAINESGLYCLILKSKKKEAKEFKKWITQKVLPAIRKYGSYSIFQDNSFQTHLDTKEQIHNSKMINSSNYQKGGVEQIKEYNQMNCLLHAGKSTSFVKEYGKKKGLKSKDYQSAKAVLRKTHPHIACAMSFADSIIYHNPDRTLGDIHPISRKAIEVFDEMIKLGITPVELKK